MDNIYQELNLHPDMPFEQIRQELSDKEQTWRRREGKRPELARKKLYAIEQAKTIFSSPASKAEYDKQLFNLVEEKGFSSQEDEAVAEWFSDANNYHLQGQYDLARAAVDKLLDLLNPGTEKPEYYCLASTIYRENKDFNGAIQLAGRAILIDPENPEGYFLKGVALSCQYYETRENGLAEQSRNEYKLALDKAVRSGNQYFIGAAAGCLAVSYADDIPQDISLAVSYAQQAVAAGDPLQVGADVLKSFQGSQQITQGKRQTEEYKNEDLKMSNIIHETIAKKDSVESRFSLVTKAYALVGFIGMVIYAVSYTTLRGGLGAWGTISIFYGLINFAMNWYMSYMAAYCYSLLWTPSRFSINPFWKNYGTFFFSLTSILTSLAGKSWICFIIFVLSYSAAPLIGAHMGMGKGKSENIDVRLNIMPGMGGQ